MVTTAEPTGIEQEAAAQGAVPFLTTVMRWAFPDDVPYSFIEFPADINLAWAQTQYAEALNAYRRVRDANTIQAAAPAPQYQQPAAPAQQPQMAAQPPAQAAPVCPVHQPRAMKFFPQKGDWSATWKCTAKQPDGSYCDQRVAA